MTLLIMLMYIVFILSAIVLVVVILLQEGKGGGLTAALGTSGQQTFGVGASGINKFTAWVGVTFLLSAMLIHYFNRLESRAGTVGEFGMPQVVPSDTSAPAGGEQAPAPPAGGQTPPPPSEPPK
jgi:preprotein translocase subunit SecG